MAENSEETFYFLFHMRMRINTDNVAFFPSLVYNLTIGLLFFQLNEY